jgi:hypothetical protein
LTSLNRAEQALKHKKEDPMEEGFKASVTQEGNGVTFISQNGLAKLAAVVKKGNLESKQKGDHVYFNANNAEGGNEEATLQLHKECMASIMGESVQQREEGGQVLGGQEVAMSDVRKHRALVYGKARA